MFTTQHIFLLIPRLANVVDIVHLSLYMTLEVR